MIAIPGAEYRFYHRSLRRYDYAKAPTTCPTCGGLGMPWSGWYSCEGQRCGTIALVTTGEVFVPARDRGLVRPLAESGAA